MEASRLEHLALEFGTPTYVYDGQRIIQQYRKLQNSFRPHAVKLHYAMKALSNVNILRLLKNEGAGIDAVSIQEVHLALRAGFDPKEIMFTPNGIHFDELLEACTLGTLVNIDNLSLLEKFGAYFGDSYPCCIRINPHIMAGGNNHISVGHIDSKFGISIHQVRHLLRIVEHYAIRINGLHMHTGSDILDAEVFLRGAELLYEVADAFPDLEFMDFGSGFKVAYREDDLHTDIRKVGKQISASFAQFCSRYGRELELKFEPGKYLVSEAGTLLVRTNVVKQTTSTVFAGVDSGQNHLIRPMMYKAYHRIENVSNPKGDKKLYSVVGNICESDTFGHDRLLHEVREGDILAIANAGAYGFSMSNQYNSRYRPAEVLVLNETAHLIRRRETLDDLTRNEVEIPQLSAVNQAVEIV